MFLRKDFCKGLGPKCAWAMWLDPVQLLSVFSSEIIKNLRENYWKRGSRQIRRDSSHMTLSCEAPCCRTLWMLKIIEDQFMEEKQTEGY